MILVALGPQSSLSVVGKPSAKRPEAVMVSVILIFDGMVLLRRSCNRSGMTRLEGLYGGVAYGCAQPGQERRVAFSLSEGQYVGLQLTYDPVRLICLLLEHAKIILEVGGWCV